jgi:hypothetical protein
MQTAGSVEIDRPIDEVFKLTHDHVAEWSIIVVEDEPIEEKPGRVGSTFRTVTEERGNRVEFLGTVTLWQPPRKSAIHMTCDWFDIEAEYTFEDLRNGRTRVTQNSQVHPQGFTKVFFLLFGWMMKKSGCKAATKELESLKKFCESRQPVPAS